MALPNFVIGGAPKCGTTSLFDWLAVHPQVCASNSKEPFFLMDVGHPLRRKDCNFHDHGLGAYSKVFPRCSDQETVIVEGSTQYIYQDTAREVLAALPSRPRVLFVVRKPSERIFSLFAYYKNKGNIPKQLSFAEFVHRISTIDDPDDVLQWASRASPFVLPLQYSRYVEYLAAWRESFGDERLRVIVFEAMRADPKNTVQDICHWIGIDPAFYGDFDFTPRNRTYSIRSHAVQRIANMISARIRSGTLKEAIKRAYYGVQSSGEREKRTAADEASLRRLDAYYAPFNDRLAQEFGLDLGTWK